VFHWQQAPCGQDLHDQQVRRRLTGVYPVGVPTHAKFPRLPVAALSRRCSQEKSSVTVGINDCSRLSPAVRTLPDAGRSSGSIKVTAFWEKAPRNLVEVYRFRRACCLYQGDDWSSTHLWNVGLLQRSCMAIYPRRLSSWHSPPWEPKSHQFPWTYLRKTCAIRNTHKFLYHCRTMTARGLKPRAAVGTCNTLRGFTQAHPIWGGQEMTNINIFLVHCTNHDVTAPLRPKH
jgi:hypothetical protein